MYTSSSLLSLPHPIRYPLSVFRAPLSNFRDRTHGPLPAVRLLRGRRVVASLSGRWPGVVLTDGLDPQTDESLNLQLQQSRASVSSLFLLPFLLPLTRICLIYDSRL